MDRHCEARSAGAKNARTKRAARRAVLTHAVSAESIQDRSYGSLRCCASRNDSPQEMASIVILAYISFSSHLQVRLVYTVLTIKIGIS